MLPSVQLSSEAILGLAPATLTNCRSTRYCADEQAIHLAALSANDRAIVVSLYELLGELLRVLPKGELEDPSALRELLARRDPSMALEQVRRLGADAHEPRLQVIIHDLRGGAMSTLFVHLARLSHLPCRVEIARALFLAARDHRKMMRNLIDDLDPENRARDLGIRPHSLGDLVRALRDFTAESVNGVVTVEVICQDECTISESCVECAALDRAAYNLLNNAVAYGEPPIRAWLVRLAHDLRVVVANGISATHGETLRATLEKEPAALFGAFTTSGSGHGLRIVCELVGRAYGVPSIATLATEGYLGAKIEQGAFVSWFHWPLVGA